MPVRSFPELLSEALQRAGISQRELARRVGMNSTLLSKAMRRQRTLTAEILGSMCVHLSVPEGERDGFVIAGLLEHCPDEVVERFRRMEQELGRQSGYPESTSKTQRRKSGR